jgi:hypothetical protein
MERGDIGDYTRPGQACVFEGLIASPPEKKKFSLSKHDTYQRQGKWEQALALWVPNELALKSLINHVRRLGITTDVITFLSPDAVDPIYNWLLRKGVSTGVYYYTSAQAYADDLKYDYSIRNVYVPSSEIGAIIGMRATTVAPTTIWGT